MTTGVAVCHRPLARVKIIRDMSALVIKTCETSSDSKLEALAFDDEDSDVAETSQEVQKESA